jgi:dUTP pyrophosphatase
MMTAQVSVGVHKLHPEAFDPVYATDGSACFDIRACFPNGRCSVKAYTANSKDTVLLAVSETGEPNHITIQPNDRVMVPTQLVFDIPEGWSMRVHMRSGLALKGGLVLSNSEGVIDSDYTDQLMILVTNTSTIPVRINHGDRICQGELVPVYRTEFFSCQKPEPKANRTGGFGSTGKA